MPRGLRHSRHEFEFALPGVAPGLLWALLSDTGRTSRAMGLPAGRFRMGTDEQGRPIEIGEARQLGFAVAWTAGPDSWIEGRSMHAVRRFLRGPLREATTDVLIAPSGDGCLVRATLSVEGGAVARGYGALLGGPRFRRWIAEAGTLVRATSAGLDPKLPAVAALSGLALAEPTKWALPGGGQPTDERALATRVLRLRERAVSSALVDRLVAFLRQQPDADLAAIRVLQLADLWGVPRRDLLRLFLHATDVGLLELHWSFRCPACRVPAGRSAHLERVPKEQRCPGCGLVFAPDLTYHIEATFSVHPSLRRLQSLVYCTAGTATRPHVFAQIVLRAGEAQRWIAPLPPGELLVRSIHLPGQLLLTPPHPRALGVVARAGGLEREAGEGEAAGVPEGSTALAFRSEVRGPPSVLVVERAGWSADWVSAAALATLSEFHELFAGEAPSLRGEISVGRITLLFSDLRGSTELYERLGDAPAYSLVEEHFEWIGRLVDRFEGAIVKTIGDAVMAAFTSPAQGLRAALAIQSVAATGEAGSVGLGLKLGLHCGTCLAVRANGRLDFFGHAVNLAARAQSQSRGGDLVLTLDMVNDPEVQELLAGFHHEPFDALLKGLEGPQRLFRVTMARESSGS